MIRGAPFTMAHENVLNNRLNDGVLNSQETEYPKLLAYITQIWSYLMAPLAPRISVTAQPLVAGVNPYNLTDPITGLLQEIGSIDVTLDLSDWQGNLTYLGMEYGNYGCVRFGDKDAGFHPVQWINWPESVFTAPTPTCDRVDIFLKIGLTGTVDINSWRGTVDTLFGGATYPPSHIYNPYYSALGPPF